MFFMCQVTRHAVFAATNQTRLRVVCMAGACCCGGVLAHASEDTKGLTLMMVFSMALRPASYGRGWVGHCGGYRAPQQTQYCHHHPRVSSQDHGLTCMSIRDGNQVPVFNGLNS